MFCIWFCLRSFNIPSTVPSTVLFMYLLRFCLHSVYVRSMFDLCSLFALSSLWLYNARFVLWFRLRWMLVSLNTFTLNDPLQCNALVVSVLSSIPSSSSLPPWHPDHRCNHRHCLHGRYVACALPWDGRVSVIQCFCSAQNEHLLQWVNCTSAQKHIMFSSVHKISEQWRGEEVDVGVMGGTSEITHLIGQNRRDWYPTIHTGHSTKMY